MFVEFGVTTHSGLLATLEITQSLSHRFGALLQPADFSCTGVELF